MRGYPGPISFQFSYVTVDMLRAEGIDANMIPDDRARDMIVMVSNWINWLTQQWFLPVRAIAKCEGRNSCLAHLPTFVPILDFFSLHLAKENLFDVILPDISYQVKPRFVQMLSYTGKLPGNPRFVILDGVFGWLEDDYQPARTTVTSAVSVGDSNIQLASMDRINVGDAVLVGKDEYPLSGAVLVDAIRGNAIVTDPVKFSCPVGSPAVRYGRVPRGIQWATMLLVKDKRTPLGCRGTEDDPDLPRWFYDRLQSESVEGYSYSLANIPAMFGHAGGSWTTGNPEADDLLQQYANPMLYVGATT